MTTDRAGLTGDPGGEGGEGGRGGWGRGCKGSVINYGEGEGASKWENCKSGTFCAPPPPHLHKKVLNSLPPPPHPLKSGNPPSVWLKIQAPVLKLLQSFRCLPPPPFSIAQTFSDPLFCRGITSLAPPPYRFVAPFPHNY